jgi:excisionase family DNA binding protein
MQSPAALLARALAWTPAPGWKPDLDDPIKLQFVYTGHALDPANILTPEELAARLKVPESWVYEKTRARCRNPIPCLRLGRYVRFDWSAVIAWLQADAAEQKHAARPNLQTKRRVVR